MTYCHSNLCTAPLYSFSLSPSKQDATKNGLTIQLLTPFFVRLKICFSWAVLIEGHIFLWMAGWKKKNGAILILRCINLVDNGCRKSLDDLLTLNGRHFRLSTYFRRNLQRISQKIKGFKIIFNLTYSSKGNCYGILTRVRTDVWWKPFTCTRKHREKNCITIIINLNISPLPIKQIKCVFILVQYPVYNILIVLFLFSSVLVYITTVSCFLSKPLSSILGASTS